MKIATLNRVSVILALFLFGQAHYAYSQFNINESFNNNTTTSNVSLNGSASLTSGNTDPAGQGWLRLTHGTNNLAGSAVVQQAFPSNMGVLIDFEYTTWSPPGSGNGADGISFFLFDASYTDSFHVGGNGGSLGYAQRTEARGLSGGYMGIGLDEFGNYSNPTEGRIGGPGFIKNSVALRGPAPDYTYLGGNQVIPSDTGSGDNGGIDYNTTTATRPTIAQFYRRVQVVMKPNNGFYTITVKWKKHQTDSFSTLFGPVTMTTPPPPMLKLGLAASTGASHNYHEIRNLVITTPGNISVTKQGPEYISNTPSTTTMNYDITVQNQTSVRVSDINIQDLLPPNYTVDPATDITIDQYNNVTNTVTNLAVNNGILSGIASLAPNTEITLHVNGTISNLQVGQSIRNTVKVSSASIIDTDTTNNADTVYTLVQIPLPIKLNYFTALKQQNDVVLNWATDMEIINDHFNIERSEDGKTFETIGTVKGKVTTNATSTYQLKDKDAVLKHLPSLFYRLLQVDKTGHSEYSSIRIVSLNKTGKDNSLQAFPIPFKEAITIQLDNATTGNASISIYNTAGQKVYHSDQATIDGSNVIQLTQLQGLPTGNYILECVQNQVTNSLKISKQ
jgi:hypothetical protein